MQATKGSARGPLFRSGTMRSIAARTTSHDANAADFAMAKFQSFVADPAFDGQDRQGDDDEPEAGGQP